MITIKMTAKFVRIFLLIDCVAINILTSATTSINSGPTSADGSQLTNIYTISLSGFKLLYSNVNQNLAPVFQNTYNDITNKLTEFQNMQGIQEFLSLGSLYAQLLPAYSICKQQIETQMDEFTSLITASVPETEQNIVLLSATDLQAFHQSNQLIVAGDQLALNGITQQIDAIENITINSNYILIGNTIEMPATLATSISIANNIFTSGNQKIANGFQSILNINFTQLIAYQNNPTAIIFLQNLYNFTANIHSVYNNIVDNQQYQNTAFQSNTNTFKNNIKKIYSIINQTAIKLAKSFRKISQYQYNFENQLK